MKTTIHVARDRAADQSRTVLPAELARGFYVTNAPSLAALKLLHVLLGTAAGAMAEDRSHSLRLAAIRAVDGMKNHDRTSLTPLFEELAAVVITDDDTEKQLVSIGGIVDEARIDYREEASGELAITWTFRRSFQRMAEQSQYWAIIDRQTVFHMQSKYSVLLFQHIQSYENYEHKDTLELTVPQLRMLLGIPSGINKRFADLRRNVLTPAIAEINQLSRLQLAASYQKTGRTVTKVTIHWQAKPDQEPAKRELAGSRVGRTARRTGAADTPAAPAFPASGGIAYEPYWLALKQKAGCNMDNAMVADRFREWCAGRGLALDARNIADTFAAYCAKVGRV